MSAIVKEPAALPARGVVPVRVEIAGMRFPAKLLLFAQGRSYTGEEAAELHLPGNLVLARQTLAALHAAGARPAEAGEFTARAFFNGRLDLTEAEGVAATIAATNARELAAARQLGCGELTRRLRPITDDLTQTLSLLEAGIDFSEEDIRFLSADALKQRVGLAQERLNRLVAESSRLERLSHEPTVVLCGRPNAGKSTLLNALAGHARAVVSNVAGTTRDLLGAEVELERGAVRVVDTAGIESDEATKRRSDEGEEGITRQMRDKALMAVEGADVVVLVREMGDDADMVPLPRGADLVVWSKADLGRGLKHEERVSVSAHTGAGLELLRRRLDELAFGAGAGAAGGERLALNARHLRQIEVARVELSAILEGGSGSDELMAEHLRYALNALGEITGLVSPDEVLGKIFSRFCIGK